MSGTGIYGAGHEGRRPVVVIARPGGYNHVQYYADGTRGMDVGNGVVVREDARANPLQNAPEPALPP